MSCHEIRNPNVFSQQVIAEIVKENPNHKFHLGKMILGCMRRNYRHEVVQIDAGTGTEQTTGSFLDRSIALAQAFRNIGLRVGDVVTVMGRNRFDVPLPMMAALFTGVAFNGVDWTLTKPELRIILSKSRPKLVFCEVANVPVLSELSEELHFRIVTFTSSQDRRYPSFREFVDQNRSDENYDDFKATDFDPVTTTAFVLCTSGTTGMPKLADVTHANFAPGLAMSWNSDGPTTDIDTFSRVMCLAPIYWLTCINFHVQCAMFASPKIMSSAQLSPRIIVDIINKYKPTVTAMTPALAAMLLKRADAIQWKSFHTFVLAGSQASPQLMSELNKRIGRSAVLNVYGLTECCGRVFFMADNAAGTLGMPIPGIECKIVDPKTGKELGDNEPGELYIKGGNVFRGYYNDESSTKEVFSEDGWFMTGDIMYRNSKQHYCYVDRDKVMMDVNVDGVHFHVSAAEIEAEIKKLQGVSDVAVTGVMREHSALPLALVVRNNGHLITAEDIIKHVQNTLSKAKHLTGGVMFMDSLPIKSMGKTDRRKIKEIATEYYNTVHS